MKGKIVDISGIVEKRGKHYLHVLIDDKYKSRLEIDENTEHLREGDTFAFPAISKIEPNAYNCKYSYTVATEETIEKANQAECGKKENTSTPFNPFRDFNLDSNYTIRKGDMFVIDGRCYEAASCKYGNHLGYGSIDDYHNTFNYDNITFVKARDISNTETGKEFIRDYNIHKQYTALLANMESIIAKTKEILRDYIEKAEQGEEVPFSEFHNIKGNDGSFALTDDYIYGFIPGNWEYDIDNTYKKCPVSLFAEVIDNLKAVEKDYAEIKTFIETHTQNLPSYRNYFPPIFVKGNHYEDRPLFENDDCLDVLEFFIDEPEQFVDMEYISYDDCFALDDEYEVFLIDNKIVIRQYEDDACIGRSVLEFATTDEAKEVFEFSKQEELICSSEEEYIEYINHIGTDEISYDDDER